MRNAAEPGAVLYSYRAMDRGFHGRGPAGDPVEWSKIPRIRW